MSGRASEIHAVDSEASWQLCQVVQPEPCETATHREVNTTEGQKKKKKIPEHRGVYAIKW